MATRSRKRTRSGRDRTFTPEIATGSANHEPVDAVGLGLLLPVADRTEMDSIADVSDNQSERDNSPVCGLDFDGEQYRNRWDYIYSSQGAQDPAVQEYLQQRSPALELSDDTHQVPHPAIATSYTTRVPALWSNEYLDQIERDIDTEYASPLLAHQSSVHNALTASTLATLRCLSRRRRVLRAISYNSQRASELEQQLLSLRQQRVVYEAYMAYNGLGL